MTLEAKKAWLGAGAYAAFIFLVSSMSHPIPYIPGMEKYPLDKIFHVIEYGVFGWLLTRAIRSSFPERSFAFFAAAAFFIGVLYAASDEWHQSFVPHRGCDPKDLAADAIGVGLGIAIWSMCNRHRGTPCR